MQGTQVQSLVGDIGYEDPITREFVPSSGKPGRRKKNQTEEASAPMHQPEDSSYYVKYKQALEELDKQRDANKALSEQIQSLKNQLEAMNNAIDSFVRSVHTTRM